MGLCNLGFPGDSVAENPPANAGDVGDACLIPESGRSPGGRNSNPLQYSCLDNTLDRGAWWATVHGVARARHDQATEHALSGFSHPMVKQSMNHQPAQTERKTNHMLGISRIRWPWGSSGTRRQASSASLSGDSRLLCSFRLMCERKGWLQECNEKKTGFSC